MSDIDDLIAFLTARLDEDEAAAKAVEDNGAPWAGQWRPRERHALETYNGWVLAVSGPISGDFAPGVVEHIARYDPARALREVEAKRRLLAETWGGPDHRDMWEHHVRLLASVWSGHPGYRPEWASPA